MRIDEIDDQELFRRANAFGGILMAGGKILLREPANHFGGYVWTFAKGRMDAGETPQEAALREVFEETGYRAKITGMIPRIFGGDTSGTLFFLMSPVGSQGSFGWETERTVWVTPDEAMKLVSQNETPTGRKRDMEIVAAVKQLG